MTNNMRFLLLLAKHPYSSLHVKAIKNTTNSFMAQMGNFSIRNSVILSQGFLQKHKKTNKKLYRNDSTV